LLRSELPNQPMHLTIDAAALFDAQGQPIDGNGDGQPGGSLRRDSPGRPGPLSPPPPLDAVEPRPREPHPRGPAPPPPRTSPLNRWGTSPRSASMRRGRASRWQRPVRGEEPMACLGR
jgi:hypothetical protein